MAQDKINQARLEGMDYALRIAKEKGIDELEKDVRRRCRYNIPVGLNQKALNDFTLRVKQNMLDTLTVVVDATLHDEFGFGKKRLEQFRERFVLKSECIGENFCSWTDYLEMLEEECGVELNIRWNDKNVKN